MEYPASYERRERDLAEQLRACNERITALIVANQHCVEALQRSVTEYAEWARRMREEIANG